jgi:retinol dehydrogenase 12
VRSGFGMDGDMTGLMGLGNKVIRPFEIGPAAGAKTSVYLASSTEVAGKTGQYWVRCKPGHMSTHARSDEQASRLWSVSEELLRAGGFAAAF